MTTEPQRILVVDDDPVNRRLLQRMLSRLGTYRVDEAGEGRAGIALAAARRYDAVLLDISMPDVNGIEVCAAIRASSCRDSRIIACTAHASERDAEHFRDSGFDAVLVKPFLMAQLASVLAG